MLSKEERNRIFPPCLPAFVRISKAFPPLVEDVVSLLLQYGKTCVSESCLQGYASPKNFDMTLGNETLEKDENEEDEGDSEEGPGSTRKHGAHQRISHGMRDEVDALLRHLPSKEPLSVRIQATFNAIIANSILEKRAF